MSFICKASQLAILYFCRSTSNGCAEAESIFPTKYSKSVQKSKLMAIPKYFAVTCCAVTTACLLIAYQTNLTPSSPLQGSLQEERHLLHHNRRQDNHLFDYDDFFSGGLQQISTRRKTEVPRLILGEEIRYLINNPICDRPLKGLKEGPETFMLILVTSHAAHSKWRRKLRQAVPQAVLDGLKIKRLFLLAKPPPKGELREKDVKFGDGSIKDIFEENREFQDILMGDFTEHYTHLTYKHLMGLEWASTFCQNAKFVVKMDDDVLVDYFQLYEMLTKGELGTSWGERDSFIFGKILSNQLVEREPTSKWFVPEKDFPQGEYPPYVSGWAYLTTITTIQDILKATQSENYFFIDDVFVTGILREKANRSIKLIDMDNHFTHYKGQLLCCVSVPQFTRSPKTNEPFWCDYLVGPSNDDEDLMQVFWRHSQYCWVSKQCKTREENERLSRKCVITGNMKIQDFAGQFKKQDKPRPLPIIRKQ